jgi:hypothetical protein
MRRIEDRQPDTQVERPETPTDPITIAAIRDLQEQLLDTREFEKKVGITPLELIQQIRTGQLGPVARQFLRETKKEMQRQ